MRRSLNPCGICLILAVMLLPNWASAQSNNSANDNMPGCRNFIKKSAENVVDAYRQGICVGTIDGLLFASVGKVCLPKDSTLGQAMRVVVAYIDARPARLHEDFRLLSLEALREAFPCKP
jgi:hypothetical protein